MIPDSIHVTSFGNESTSYELVEGRGLENESEDERNEDNVGWESLEHELGVRKTEQEYNWEGRVRTASKRVRKRKMDTSCPHYS